MFFARTVTRRRYGTPTLGVDRRPLAPSQTDSDLAATVQPLSEHARVTLPEGVRGDYAVKVFAPLGSLRLADSVNGVLSDALVLEGLPDVPDGVYVVQRLASWHAPIAHDEAACTLQQPLRPRAGTPAPEAP